jgi:hypothetical protein
MQPNLKCGQIGQLTTHTPAMLDAGFDNPPKQSHRPACKRKLSEKQLHSVVYSAPRHWRNTCRNSCTWQEFHRNSADAYMCYTSDTGQTCITQTFEIRTTMTFCHTDLEPDFEDQHSRNMCKTQYIHLEPDFEDQHSRNICKTQYIHLEQ